MPLRLRVLLALGFLLAGFGQVIAADRSASPTSLPYIVDTWETDDGLPQGSVITMTQTRDGYLWLGTLNGLVRFDGIRFTVFDESNTPGLESSRIVKLFEDSKGNLWVGTETAGVVMIREGRLTSLGIGRGSRDTRLESVCEDALGAVWLYTADGQLWRYLEGATNLFHTISGPSHLRTVMTDDSKLLWVASDFRLFAKDPTAPLSPPDLGSDLEATNRSTGFIAPSRQGGHWRLADRQIQRWQTNRLVYTFAEPVPWSLPVMATVEDADGNLVVGTRGEGLFWFNASGQFTHMSTTNGLRNDLVLSLLVDREGTLWAGTDGGGLNRIRRQVFNVVEGSESMTVRSVAEDPEGGVWFGSNGAGMAHWTNGPLQHFSYVHGLVPHTWSVWVDAQSNVWAGTRDRGLVRSVGNRFHPTGFGWSVTAILEGRDRRLWVGSPNGLAVSTPESWRLFTPEHGLSASEVRALAEDRDGTLWIGTRGGGLNRFKDGKFSAYRVGDGLPSDDISSLILEDDGTLWVGTLGNGLARFHKGEWSHFTTRHGLPSPSVAYLLDDQLGYLWIGSNQGLTRVNKQALHDFADGRNAVIPLRTYGRRDGLPTRECTGGSQPAACRARNGRLWFPTTRGLAWVEPSSLQSNTNPPPVVIEAVLIDGEPQITNALEAIIGKTITIPANRHSLEIHFTSLNLASPEAARFKYRLHGHDNAWYDAGDSRVARFSILPSPGQYRFEVTARNEDGVWNPVGSFLALIIQPPFWRTWWFIALLTASVLGLIVATVHYLSTQKLQRQLTGLRQQEAVEKERARIARDIHDQLGANLTQVALLGELVESDKNSPEEVESHARMISQTARDTTRSLDEIVWTVNPSNDTLDGLVTYLCKYAQDYMEVAGLRYRLDVPAQLPATPIPPEVRHNVFLAAKEAITNIVRHAQASAAMLRLRLEPGYFILEIEDNGKGPAGAEGKTSRNGLRNMRRRMEDVGGEFSMTAAPEGGTRIRLTVPLGRT